MWLRCAFANEIGYQLYMSPFAGLQDAANSAAPMFVPAWSVRALNPEAKQKAKKDEEPLCNVSSTDVEFVAVTVRFHHAEIEVKVPCLTINGLGKDKGTSLCADARAENEVAMPMLEMTRLLQPEEIPLKMKTPEKKKLFANMMDDDGDDGEGAQQAAAMPASLFKHLMR